MNKNSHRASAGASSAACALYSASGREPTAINVYRGTYAASKKAYCFVLGSELPPNVEVFSAALLDKQRHGDS